MNTLYPFMHYAAPFALILARISGVFLFTPLLSGSTLPVRARAMIAMSLSAAVFAFGPEAVRELPRLDLVTYIPLMFSEVLLGASIGLIGGLPLLLVQLAGYLMGYQMGLSIAQTFNPSVESQGDVAGQLLFYLGVSVYVTLGGLDFLFFTLLNTYDNVPMGAFSADMTPVDLLVGVIHGGFEMALSVAAPVLGIITLLLIAMGFIMKTMPQVNVLSIGFSAKILCGLLMLTFTIFLIAEITQDETVQVLTAVRDWAESLRPRE